MDGGLGAAGVKLGGSRWKKMGVRGSSRVKKWIGGGVRKEMKNEGTRNSVGKVEDGKQKKRKGGEVDRGLEIISY